MKSEHPDSVSVIIPTHNRREPLLQTIAWALTQQGVIEVIAVVDRCVDGTEDSIKALGDPRLRVLTSSSPGPQSARNMGIAASNGNWLLIIDDDDRYPKDFVAQLKQTAEESGADLVGAPHIGVVDDSEVESKVASLRANCGEPNLHRVSVFPCDQWVDTPWMCTPHLLRRSCITKISYDPKYRGTFWREETDYFVAAVRQGCRVVLTGRTFLWSPGVLPGGVSKDRRLRYEYWAIRNHARFLWKHGVWLYRNGYLERPLVNFLRFCWNRFCYRLSGTLKRRFRVARGITR